MTGSRGPLPKPNVLKLLAGNPGKRPLNLADGVNPRVEIPSVPKHLGTEARREWKRITPLLEELGLISGMDRAALSLYCQAYGRLVELETAFKGKVELVMDKDKLSYADAVYRCSYAKAPKTGYEQQSVIVQLIRSHREEVNRYLGHFGLSPAARARVTPSNYVQPSLPGIDALPTQASGFAKFAQHQA
jgi:P27 family predicted phage terminase small subunit